MRNLLIFSFIFFVLWLPPALAEEALPIMSPIGNREVGVGETLSFAISAYDPKGRLLFYEASNLPHGAKLDPKTGEFQWTPTIFQVGEHRVTFQAWDRIDPQRRALETINIRVVYRKTYQEKKWGLGLGKEEVVETSAVEDLYPKVSAVKINGAGISLEEEKVMVPPSFKMEVELESIYRVDPKLIAISLDGKEQRRIRQAKIKTFGERRDIVGLTLEVAFRNLSSKKHELVIMVGNELGIATHKLILEVRGKSL
jgi:hypothetical protein